MTMTSDNGYWATVTRKAERFFVGHKKPLLVSSVSLIALTTGVFNYVIPSNYWLYPALYIAAIVIPIILGMMGKMDFKWVVLWEAVILLPVVLVVGLVAVALFAGARRRPV